MKFDEIFWKEPVIDIYRKLLQKGFICYFFGQTVRNLILKIPSTFYYILTTADLIALSQLFDHIEFPGKVDYDGEIKYNDFIVRFKIIDLPSDKADFQILRKESFTQLLTIDTIYYDTKKERFLDPLECYYDFREKKIKVTPDFLEIYKNKSYKIFDILHLLSNYDFILEEDIKEKIEKLPFIFKKEYLEETKRGLNDILTSKNPYIAMNLMDKFNIIKEI
jgi:tRNA nucleotidyltransferase/poly(A) polymerase